VTTMLMLIQIRKIPMPTPTRTTPVKAMIVMTIHQARNTIIITNKAINSTKKRSDRIEKNQENKVKKKKFKNQTKQKQKNNTKKKLTLLKS
jgi:translation elongation factor EF-4